MIDDFSFIDSPLQKWLLEWRTKNSINPDGSLSQEQTICFVQEIYNQMDLLGYYDLPEGAVIIPYSSSALDTPAWKIAEGISKNSDNLYFISDSIAGILINDLDFIMCVNEVIQNDGFSNQLIESKTKYILGDEGDGGILSLNDQVSAQVMLRYGHGDIFTITEGAEGWNVWIRTELPILLSQQSVDSISGIPRKPLYDFYLQELALHGEESALMEIGNIIAKQSAFQHTIVKAYDLTELSDEMLQDIFGTNYASYIGKGRIIVDTSNLPNSLGNKIPEEVFQNPLITQKLLKYQIILSEMENSVANDPVFFKFTSYIQNNAGLILSDASFYSQDFIRFSTIYGELDPRIQGNAKLWQKLYSKHVEYTTSNGLSVILPSGMEGLIQAAENLKIYSSIKSTLGKLVAPVAATIVIVDMVNTFHKITDSFEKGNYEEGFEILRQWGCDTGGAFICAAGSSALVEGVLGTALLGLAATGPVGIAGALLISIGLPILTTICFSDEVSEILNGLSEAISCLADVCLDAWDAISRDWAGLWKDSSAAQYIDPLILDIGGDGFTILSKLDGANFDLDCNGFAEKMNWTNTDGFLALDLNGNGTIDDGRELFGNNTLLSDNKMAKNGFEALSQYDSNHDGIIDANDEIFSKLMVWADRNGDGVSTSGELKMLSELDITSISLNKRTQTIDTGAEANIGNVAEFTYGNGSTAEIGELWVSSDLFDTRDVPLDDIPDDILKLPDVRSIGNVSSLRNAMTIDTSGILKNLVHDFICCSNPDQRYGILESILLKITKAENAEEVPVDLTLMLESWPCWKRSWVKVLQELMALILRTALPFPLISCT